MGRHRGSHFSAPAASVEAMEGRYRYQAAGVYASMKNPDRRNIYVDPPPCPACGAAMMRSNLEVVRCSYCGRYVVMWDWEAEELDGLIV